MFFNFIDYLFSFSKYNLSIIVEFKYQKLYYSTFTTTSMKLVLNNNHNLVFKKIQKIKKIFTS